jgi:hypothetical protein
MKPLSYLDISSWWQSFSKNSKRFQVGQTPGFVAKTKTTVLQAGRQATIFNIKPLSITFSSPAHKTINQEQNAVMEFSEQDVPLVQRYRALERLV